MLRSDDGIVGLVGGGMLNGADAGLDFGLNLGKGGGGNFGLFMVLEAPIHASILQCLCLGRTIHFQKGR